MFREGKEASYSRHLKVPHDLLWTMNSWFERNPFTHWKHLRLNCPHQTLTEHFDVEKWDRLNRSELILTRGERSSCPSHDLACRCVSLEPDYNTLSLGAYKHASLRASEPMSLRTYIAGIFCLRPDAYPQNVDKNTFFFYSSLTNPQTSATSHSYVNLTSQDIK